MTTIFQTTDIISVGSAVTTSTTPALVSGQLFYLTEGTNVVSTSTRAFFASTSDPILDYNWIINGNVHGDGGAIFMYDTAASGNLDYSLEVGATGTISSRSSFAVHMGSDGANTTGEIHVSNAGSILCTESGAMLLFAATDMSLSNTGTIRTHATDTSFSSAVAMVKVTTGNLFNSGLIETAAGTTSSAGSVIEDVAAISVRGRFSVTSDSTITNTGIVRGATHSVYMDVEDARLINSGLLDGSVFFDFANGNGILDNSGTIFGYVSMNTGVDILTNTGTISGDIYTADGADVFDGRGGTVNGDVYGGLGDDTYIIDDADLLLVELAAEGIDLVKSTVSYGLGDNFENLTLIGSGNTSGIGNGEDNTLTGNIGNNTLRGKAGTDIVNGGDGDDRLYGGGGGDTLSGGADDDMLRGGKGNDTLNGGGENDVLIGGVGKDDLTGGSGEDVFRFVKANHSLDSGLADSILDFTAGDDLIDLSALPGTLAFIGSGAFSGAAEVRVSETGGGDSIVRVDVDGDGSADMKIKVLGVVGLDAGDFLL